VEGNPRFLNRIMSEEKTNVKEANQANKPKSRDVWDKITIFSSFFSLVVLGGLTFWLNQKTAEIQSQVEILKTNIQTGQLVQQLLDDLQSPESRRDIALIALNRTIADKDESSKKMVAEIAMQTYKETLKRLISDSNKKQINLEDLKKDPSFQDTFIAYQIVNERDPSKANELFSSLLKLQDKAKNDKDKEFFGLLIKSISPGISIYYRDTKQQEFIDKLKEKLKGENVRVGLPEFIKPEDVQKTYPLDNNKPTNKIKYFYATNIDQVKKIQEMINNSSEIKFEIEFLPEQQNVPYGQIEIWVYDSPNKGL
jgi:hypothetical protein